MQGAKHSDARWHREPVQRRSAPAHGEPNVQELFPGRTLGPRAARGGHGRSLLDRMNRSALPAPRAARDPVFEGTSSDAPSL
jgi:hypothetical protein